MNGRRSGGHVTFKWLKDHVIIVCLFVCLSACLLRGFSSHSRNFHSYRVFTNAGERLQILTYALHSWPLSSEGSFACHTYCDTVHLFIMVISENP